MSRKQVGVVACAAAVVVSLVGCTSPGAASGGSEKDVKEVKIGFAQQTLTAPYYVAMEREAKRLTKKQGYKLIFQAANDDPVTQVDQVRTMVSQGADVIVVNAVSPETEKAQIKTIAKQTPVMFIDTPIPKVGFTTVQSDNVTIGKGAGKLMAERVGKGKKIKLALLNGGATDEVVGPQRKKGYLSGLKAGGADYKIVGNQAANFTQDDAVTATEDLLSANLDIDVIFAYNDSMALGALKTLRAKKNAHVLVSGIDGQKEGLAQIVKGCDSQYVSSGLNSPVLAARDSFKTAVDVATGKTDSKKVKKVKYTKAVGVGCKNVKQYYDPKSVF